MTNVIDASELALLREAAASHFYEVLRALLVKQITHPDAEVRYAEVIMKDGGRYDCPDGRFASLLQSGGAAR